MALIRAIINISFLALAARAHMEMSNPYPINSHLNSAVPDNLKDYSYTAPLLADGSNFPCKGYQTQSTSYSTTATYTAGGTYNMSIAGEAPHGGGSCQLSLSYDNGATFKVIKSMIGGCPLTTTYTFTIPAFAPSSSSALFAWSWFNEIGNREMYMDCARVEIQGSSPGKFRRAQHTRRDSMSSLPDMFVCNVNDGCTTVETQQVNFPNPGGDVVHGIGSPPAVSGSGFTGGAGVSANPSISMTNTMPSVTSTAVSTAVSVSPGVFAPFLNGTTSTISPSSTASASPVSPNTTGAATSTFSTITTSSPSAVQSATTLPGPCTPGTFACNSPSTFSQCTAGVGGASSYTYMGSVPAGMQCANGQIVRQNNGSCSPNGQISCKGESAFYICDQGGLVDMGPVAPGTACLNGQIQRAPSRRQLQ